MMSANFRIEEKVDKLIDLLTQSNVKVKYKYKYKNNVK